MCSSSGLTTTERRHQESNPFRVTARGGAPPRRLGDPAQLIERSTRQSTRSRRRRCTVRVQAIRLYHDDTADGLPPALPYGRGIARTTPEESSNNRKIGCGRLAALTETSDVDAGNSTRLSPPSSARLAMDVQRNSSHRVWPAQVRYRVPGSSCPSRWKTAIQPIRVAQLVARSTMYWHDFVSRRSHNLTEGAGYPPQMWVVERAMTHGSRHSVTFRPRAFPGIARSHMLKPLPSRPPAACPLREHRPLGRCSQWCISPVRCSSECGRMAAQGAVMGGWVFEYRRRTSVRAFGAAEKAAPTK